MKLSLPVALVVAACLRGGFGKTFPEKDVIEEDTSFWSRFLQREKELSVAPSWPSVPSPTNATPPSPQGPLEPDPPIPTPPTLQPAAPVAETPGQPGDCAVEVDITCTLRSGRPCGHLEPPETLSCAIGSSVQSITLSVLPGASCSDSSNNQGDEALCIDYAPTTDLARVECEDEEGERLNVEPEQVQAGGVITVSGRSGRNLSTKTDCMLIGSDGTQLQQVVIDSSGSIFLDLQNSFGALRLDSCKRDGHEIACLTTATYSVVVKNTGTLETNFTVKGESIAGELDALLLGPGESKTSEKDVEFNICNPNPEIISKLDVEAVPLSDGIGCQASIEEALPLPAEPPVAAAPSVATPAAPTAEPASEVTMQPQTFDSSPLPPQSPTTPEPSLIAPPASASSPVLPLATLAPSEPTTNSPPTAPTEEPALDSTLQPQAADIAPLATTAPTKAPISPPLVAATPTPTIESPTSETLRPSTSDPVTTTTEPTKAPTSLPLSATETPQIPPSFSPSVTPRSATASPSIAPTKQPSASPLVELSQPPSMAPEPIPTDMPVQDPSGVPSGRPSQVPSIEPTQIPSQAPTWAPSSTPTSAPQQAPSQAPEVAATATPTDAPQLAETLAPTTTPSGSPSFEPSLRPSRSPSFEPSNPPSQEPQVDCDIDVNVACATQDGRPCRDLEVVEAANCSASEGLEFLVFSFNARSCQEADNDQGDAATCQGTLPIPLLDPVTVTCADAADLPLRVEPSTVVPRGSFTVRKPAGGTLPRRINCTIADIDGNAIQSNVIDTSGNAPLALKDQFGSLTLESCVEGTSCLAILKFDVSLDNVGAVAMNLTNADFNFDNTTASLLGELNSSLVALGESAVLQLERHIDVCGGADLMATVSAEASPSRSKGNTCKDSADIELSFANLPPAPTQGPIAPPMSSPVLSPIQLTPVSPLEDMTLSPQSSRTSSPTGAPQTTATVAPSQAPSINPTRTPQADPSQTPSKIPSPIPTAEPSFDPSQAPSSAPEPAVTASPTIVPRNAETISPSVSPLGSPSKVPSASPSLGPSGNPSHEPSTLPSMEPRIDCEIEVDLECTAQDGRPCSELDAVEASCESTDGLEFVVFSYSERSCPEANNNQGVAATCQDYGRSQDNLSNESLDPLNVKCSDTNAMPLRVEPSTVVPRGSFTVRKPAGGTLPRRINCTIADIDGNAIQSNVIDTSGNAPLALKDQFGSLTLESCVEGTSCLAILKFDVSLDNVGTVAMNLTTADFNFDNTTASLLGELNSSLVAPGESVSIQQEREIDICAGIDLATTVAAEASSNGATCTDSAENSLSVAKLPPITPPVAPPMQQPIPAPSTSVPRMAETAPPSRAPSIRPSSVPSARPSSAPKYLPSATPTVAPVAAPKQTSPPTASPRATETIPPTQDPTASLSSTPSTGPTVAPRAAETLPPTIAPRTDSPVSSSPRSSSPATAQPTSTCEADISLACTSSNGQECSTISRPTLTTCTMGSPIPVIFVSYQDCNCNCGSNEQGDEARCEDFAELVEEPVTVQCTTADGEAMSVEPSPVAPGGTVAISMTQGTSLPEKITCAIIAPDETRLQEVTIDTSGGQRLNRGDRFGGLQLEGCADTSCVQRLIYTVTVKNDGDVAMVVSALDIEHNGDGTSLIEDIELSMLEPEQSTNLDQTVDFNACSGSEMSTTTATVVASPTNGRECQDRDDYEITIAPAEPATTKNPPTPSPKSPVEPPQQVSPQPVAQQLEETVPPVLPAPTRQPISTSLPTTGVPIVAPVTSQAISVPPVAPTALPIAPVPIQPPVTAQPTMQSSLVSLPETSPPSTPPPVSAAPTLPATNSPVDATQPPGDCEVDVKLTCKTTEGEECASIAPPEFSTCTDGSDIAVLSFSYQDCDCNCGSNGQGDAATCIDIAPLVEEPATITCSTPDGTPMTVAPSTVLPGGTFSVSTASGSNLPDKTSCTITAPDGTTLQTNIIDTSGSVPLTIAENFGALTLEGCDESTCLKRLVYTVEVANVGDVPLLINAATLVVNGADENLVEEFETNPLEKDGVTNLDRRFEANTCIGIDSSTVVSVVAVPPNGNQCTDSAEYNFVVSALVAPQEAPTTAAPLRTPPAPTAAVAAVPVEPTPISPPVSAPTATLQPSTRPAESTTASPSKASSSSSTTTTTGPTRGDSSTTTSGTPSRTPSSSPTSTPSRPPSSPETKTPSRVPGLSTTLAPSKEPSSGKGGSSKSDSSGAPSFSGKGGSSKDSKKSSKDVESLSTSSPSGLRGTTTASPTPYTKKDKDSKDKRSVRLLHAPTTLP